MKSKEDKQNYTGPAVTGIIKLAAEIIPKCQAWMRGPLLVSTYITVMVTVISGLIVKNTGDYLLPSVIIILALIILAFNCYVLYFRKNLVDRMKEEMQNEKVQIYSRKLPKLPIPDDRNRKQITQLLKDLRQDIFKTFQKKYRAVKIEQFRANIFMAEYDKVEKGDVCTMEMRPPFKVNMDRFKDNEIPFRPGQGATGKCFIDHEASVTVISEDIEDQTDLTLKLMRTLAPNLSWILTFPLRDKDGNAFAVLNCDCLDFEVGKKNEQPLRKELDNLKNKYQKKVDAIARLFDHYSRVRVSIVLEEAI
ncbi:hypothetical protein JW948_03790 [bacterium]|nr:hypothetical protein [bacterium]